MIEIVTCRDCVTNISRSHRDNCLERNSSVCIMDTDNTLNANHSASQEIQGLRQEWHKDTESDTVWSRKCFLVTAWEVCGGPVVPSYLWLWLKPEQLSKHVLQVGIGVDLPLEVTRDVQ